MQNNVDSKPPVENGQRSRVPRSPSQPGETPQRGPSCWVSLQNGLLWLVFALLTLAGWTRAVYAITNQYWLAFAGLRPGPIYQILTGALWGVVGLIALLWIILRRPWYRLVGTGAALLFALTYWIDRLVIVPAAAISSPAAPPGSNAVFAALLTLLCLAYAVLVLNPFGELRRLFRKEKE